MDKTQEARSRLDNCWTLLTLRRSDDWLHNTGNLRLKRERDLLLAQLSILEAELRDEGYLSPVCWTFLATIEQNLGAK